MTAFTLSKVDNMSNTMRNNKADGLVDVYSDSGYSIK